MSSPAAPTALRTLARRGAWRAVAEGAAERLRAEGPSPSALAWRALALARLGDAERAADALAAAGVPEGVAAGSAKVELDARAAAELHLVWAELPALDGKRGETVQRLYAQLGDAAAGDTKVSREGGGPSASALKGAGLRTSPDGRRLVKTQHKLGLVRPQNPKTLPPGGTVPSPKAPSVASSRCVHRLVCVIGAVGVLVSGSNADRAAVRATICNDPAMCARLPSEAVAV